MIVLLLFLVSVARSAVVTPLYAKQSSNYSASYPAFNAIDGNIHTFSHTRTEKNAWLTVYLDTVYNITKVDISGYSNYANAIFQVSVYNNKGVRFSCGRYTGHGHTKAGTFYKDSVNCGGKVGDIVLLQVVNTVSCDVTVSEMTITGDKVKDNGTRTLIMSESFEKSFNWKQVDLLTGKSSKIIARHAGSTSSGSTGPSKAADGSYYIYYEDSGSNVNPIMVSSPNYITPYSNCSIYYQIHMYGRDIQGLMIAVTDAVSNDTALGYENYKGNHGNQWISKNFGFKAPANGLFQIHVLMNGSTSYQGDIAVDDLKVYCSSSGVNPRPTQKPTQSPTPKPSPKPTPTPIPISTYFTTTDGNGTIYPPTDGSGGVKVKFGGAELGVKVPKVQAKGDLDDLEFLQHIPYALHMMIAYPFQLLSNMIHGDWD